MIVRGGSGECLLGGQQVGCRWGVGGVGWAEPALGPSLPACCTLHLRCACLPYPLRCPTLSLTGGAFKQQGRRRLDPRGLPCPSRAALMCHPHLPNHPLSHSMLCTFCVPSCRRAFKQEEQRRQEEEQERVMAGMAGGRCAGAKGGGEGGGGDNRGGVLLTRRQEEEQNGRRGRGGTLGVGCHWLLRVRTAAGCALLREANWPSFWPAHPPTCLPACLLTCPPTHLPVCNRGRSGRGGGGGMMDGPPMAAINPAGMMMAPIIMPTAGGWVVVWRVGGDVCRHRWVDL